MTVRTSTLAPSRRCSSQPGDRSAYLLRTFGTSTEHLPPWLLLERNTAAAGDHSVFHGQHRLWGSGRFGSNTAIRNWASLNKDRAPTPRPQTQRAPLLQGLAPGDSDDILQRQGLRVSLGTSTSRTRSSSYPSIQPCQERCRQGFQHRRVRLFPAFPKTKLAASRWIFRALGVSGPARGCGD